MLITLEGEPLSQKNSKVPFINPRTGKMMIVNSSRIAQWRKDLLWQLKGTPPITNYPCSITMQFYLGTQRSKDLSNLAQGYEDALVKAGVLIDDDFKHVEQLTLRYGGQDKLRPRVEIQVEGVSK